MGNGRKKTYEVGRGERNELSRCVQGDQVSINKISGAYGQMVNDWLPYLPRAGPVVSVCMSVLVYSCVCLMITQLLSRICVLPPTKLAL